MADGSDKTQAKSETITIRLTPEERDLLDRMAVALSTTRDRLIREHGVDESVKRAREMRRTFAAESA